MKLIFALLALALSTAAIADTHVKGYTRKDGTYVEPHYRSSPNSTTYDNYSTKGNNNPYTGKQGTVEPYQYNSPSYEYKQPSYEHKSIYDND